jgi:DNA-binding CsgD family transcriptional regulator
VLARLAHLIPSDEVGYCELDRSRNRVLRGATSLVVPCAPLPELLERFWRIVELHPLCLHQARTRDFSAVKLSDFMTLRQLRHTQVYSEWFGFYGVDHELETGIPSPRWHTKTFLFNRGPGRDFSERDRQMLNLLRPHLGRLYEIARLRQSVDGGSLSEPDLLTPREREVLEYLRRGHTNRQIGRILFISPLTVRRHLESIYEKLGVHSRTAAAARASELVGRGS